MARLFALATLIAVFSLIHGQPFHGEGRNSCNAGFTVKKSTARSSHAFPSSPISFHDVVTNEGGWFDDNSEFIAPCSGLYYFSFHGVAPDGDYYELALVKNGQQKVTTYGGKGRSQKGSNSALLSLRQGDKVRLELHGGSLDERYDQIYTTFSGFLVKRS